MKKFLLTMIGTLICASSFAVLVNDNNAYVSKSKILGKWYVYHMQMLNADGTISSFEVKEGDPTYTEFFFQTMMK